LAPAVEECLRYHPPFRMGRKLVRRQNSRFGPELEPGHMVVVSVQAANRDPGRWTDPDRFDVARKPDRHYSFGFGAHFCLGQALARLDVQESIWAFLRELPTARLLTQQPYRTPFTPDEQIAELRVAAR
jgi:cytochrome P450